MYQVKCTIEPIVPVMFDRFYSAQEADEGRTTKKAKNEWKKELELKLYKDKKGVYIPADSIRMMLIGNKHRPGAAKILGSFIQKNKATQYTSICEGCIWVNGIEDQLKVYFQPLRKTYDDYDERSFIASDGSRKLSRRPLLKPPCTLTFIITVTDDQVHESLLRQLFETAGLRCGVGAYGPTFGRFIIKEWQILPEKNSVQKEMIRAEGSGSV